MNDTKNELAYIRGMLEFLDTYPMVSIVGDAFDIYNFAHLMGSIKDEIIEKTQGGKFVILRPDSGNPVEVVLECLQILDKHFGSTLNEKGYKVLNNVRVIQGDGITTESIDEILSEMERNQFSTDNIAFGQGGGLLQAHDRDTLKFAMKCSAILVDGEWRDVYKQPITDMGKESKKGLIDLYKIDGQYVTKRIGDYENPVSETQIVYMNGKLFNQTNLETVRKLEQTG